MAFATEEELRQHYLQHHSTRMPRWDNSRSRPLVFDYMHRRNEITIQVGGGASASVRYDPRAGGASRRRRGAASSADASAATNGSRSTGTDRTGSGRGCDTSAGADHFPHLSSGAEQQDSGNLVIIDDNPGFDLQDSR